MIMKMSLNRFIDPANYHLDAVAKAATGSVTSVDSQWLIIRLGIELHVNNFETAQIVLRRLELEQRQGYELFQVKTAQLILALRANTKSQITTALNEWLETRKKAPENFNSDVLAAPELTAYLSDIDPAKLLTPVMKPITVPKADRVLVRDIDAARVQAVTENLGWLREAGVKGTVKAIAKVYRIVYANHHLREVTLGNNKNWPELILALDEKGDLLGSFISH